MKTTPVSRLKATLSECLAQVKAGEEIIVTERGTPIAKLIPFSPDRSFPPPHLLEMARAGLIRIGSLHLPDGFRDMPRPADPHGAGITALLEERAEER